MSSVTAPGRGRQRAVLTSGVALVAQGLLGEHRVRVGAQLARASARTLPGRGREEDLQLGLGRDDGADIPPLGHPVSVGDQLALLDHQRLAHTRVGSHTGRRLGDLGRADRLGHVAPVEQHSLRTPSSIRAPRASAAGSSPGAPSESRATQRYIAPLSR